MTCVNICIEFVSYLWKSLSHQHWTLKSTRTMKSTWTVKSTSTSFTLTLTSIMQVVMTINAAVLCYVSTPVNPKENAVACKVGTPQLLAELRQSILFMTRVNGQKPSQVHPQLRLWCMTISCMRNAQSLIAGCSRTQASEVA